MFDHQNRISGLEQCGETFQQLCDVVKMKSGRRFIKNEECVPLFFLYQMCCKFYALRFAARKCRCRLTETKIAKTNLLENLEFLRDLMSVRIFIEETDGIFNGQSENVVDVLSVPPYFKRFLFVPFAVARFACQIKIRHELHLHFLQTVTLAHVASSSGNIKGEESRQITA